MGWERRRGEEDGTVRTCNSVICSVLHTSTYTFHVHTFISSETSKTEHEWLL